MSTAHDLPFIKIHHQDDHPDLFRAVGGGAGMARLIDTERGVKCASSGLIGTEILNRFRPDRDHFMVHLIGMGDAEAFGFSRNCDSWPGVDLEKRAGTFVTHAGYYLEHANKDPSKSRGVVKYAAYSPTDHRVEILVHGHIKKAEADFEDARAGRELSFSMAARVPADVCSICNHASPSPALYCGHLRESLGRYLPEHNKYAFAINPQPTFIDISRVAAPADRIAHYLRYVMPDGVEQQVKAASYLEGRRTPDLVIPGWAWAEWYGRNQTDDGGADILTPRVLEAPVPSRLKVAAQHLLDAEQFLVRGEHTAAERILIKLACACCSNRHGALPSIPDGLGIDSLLGGLIQRGGFLPAGALSNLLHADGQSPTGVKITIIKSVPRGLRELADGNGGDVVKMLGADRDLSAGPILSGCGQQDEIDEFMNEAVERYGLDGSRLCREVVAQDSTATGESEILKWASQQTNSAQGSALDQRLGLISAAHQAAALAYMMDRDQVPVKLAALVIRLQDLRDARLTA